MEKYYLQVEIRYLIEYLNEENEVVQIPKSTFLHSELFKTEKECIIFGNKLIVDNIWMEQYPGCVGARLERKYGNPLVMFSLKNGTQIFISVKELTSFKYIDINNILREFNK